MVAAASNEGQTPGQYPVSGLESPANRANCADDIEDLAAGLETDSGTKDHWLDLYFTNQLCPLTWWLVVAGLAIYGPIATGMTGRFSLCLSKSGPCSHGRQCRRHHPEASA